MINVVVLVQDPRVRAQVEQFFAEMNLSDLRTAVFNNLAEFEALYFRTDAPSPESAAPPAPALEPAITPPASPAPTASEGPADVELRLFSEVHVVLYALDQAGDAASQAWLDRLRPSMRRHGHLPATGLRVLLLKYEDDAQKLDHLHGVLDDLIYLPLDRLVFLQKMQIFLNHPKRVAPSYLFNQPYSRRIEISKVTKLDRLSDVALAIRNPVALRRGLPGHFHLSLPGEKTSLEVKAKVLRSEPHPDLPGQFLVYFGFFGLERAGVATIRRALQKDSHYKSLLHDDHERFAYNEQNLFLSDEERREFAVVIIDRDELEATQLGNAMRTEMGRLRVEIEPSYSLFLHRYLDHEAVSFDTNMPRPTEAAEFYAAPVTLLVRAHDLTLVDLEPKPGPDDVLLGYRAADLLADPPPVISLFADRGTGVLLSEAPALASAQRPLDKIVVLHDAKNERSAAHVVITPSATEGLLRVEVGPASLGEIADRALRERKHEHLDALVVQSELVPPDPRAWIEGLRAKCHELKLTRPDQDLKFWFIARGEEVPESWLDAPEIVGILRRPVDLRQMLFSFSEHLPNLNTVYQFYNLGWGQPGLNVHVAKPIDLEALSEYGATLRSTLRFAPGSVIYLRRDIYDHAPHQALAARVYACEDHPNVEGEYEVYVTYWGITDAFLKFARTWIRENYAAQKNKA